MTSGARGGTLQSSTLREVCKDQPAPPPAPHSGLTLGLADRDVVYPVRPGDDNEELRYSLRSLVNLPHRNVWIVGHCPPWVRDVWVLETDPQPEKWANLIQSLSIACRCEEISDEITLFNDDMFVIRQIAGPELPVFHLGSLAGYITSTLDAGRNPNDSWLRGLQNTLAAMTAWGFDSPLAYESHQPMPYRRAELARLLQRADRHPFLWNSAYEATSGPRGERGANVKITGLDEQALDDKIAALASDQPYLSTDDRSFRHGAVGRYIRDLFDAPGDYEA